jgi:uncharacterized membrane protein YozB (DUF420 family)
MDPKSVFWTLALLDLSAVVLLALFGLRRIRHGQWRGHRNRMLAAVALVVGFLVAYALKLQLLGHEDLASWSPFRVAVLRVHELGIAAMLGGGLYAGYRAFRFRRTLPAKAVLPADDPASRQRVAHRWAGRIAIAGAAVAWITAVAMLAGMLV